MRGLLESLRKLGLAPLLTLAGVAIGMVGIIAYLELAGVDTSRMALLYDNLDQHDAAQVTDQLERRQISYRVEANGRRIMVPADQVLSARALLAKEGLPVAGTIVGDELFDRTNDLTVTEFEQDVKRTRALEGELERTIQSMRGIERARVHLVLPRKQPFERQPRDAQASVMLTLGGLAALPQEGIQAIVNLVAGAVPGLKPQNITLVDSHLRLLARAGDPEDLRTRSLMGEDLGRTIALRLEHSVADMLERTLGAGHVHVEAAVQLNFDKTADTQERFDPDSPVIRSTQSVTSNSKSTERNGAVSVQNNLPNADSGSQGAGAQEGRQEETTNYEISKTVHTSSSDQPRIQRLTLAVMVDGIIQANGDGKPAWQPRSQTDLDQIARLAKTAVGFDEKRGDQLEVVSLPFINEAGASPAETPILAVTRSRRDLVTLGEAAAIGLTALIIIALMSRSILRGLKPAPLSFAMSGAADAIGGGLRQQGETGGQVGQMALPAPTGGGSQQPGLPDDDATVSLDNIEGAIKASSIRRLIELTNRHPDTTLAVIRNWIASESG